LKVKGIKAYSSWDEGLEATARTLENKKFDYSGILKSLARSASPDDTIREWGKSPWGWDKSVKVGPASSYLGAALREFPGGGSFIDAGERAIKELFTPRSVKIGAVVAAGSLVIGGVVLLVYFAHSRKSAPRFATG